MRDVHDFYLVIKDLCKNVETIKSAQYEVNYKKIVSFTIIDMMSKAVYGSKYNGYRSKFTNFILQFGDWKDANRISLQQLTLILNKDTSKEFDSLRDYCFTTLSLWPTDQPINLSYDPKYDEIKKIWPEGCKINNRITLDYFKHINLLYSLRNSLIHESRALGSYFELFDSDVPHYNSLGVLKEDENGRLIELSHGTFELIHPIGFFLKLLNNSLNNMKQYCIDEGINPYENFRFGSEWVDS